KNYDDDDQFLKPKAHEGLQRRAVIDVLHDNPRPFALNQCLSTSVDDIHIMYIQFLTLACSPTLSTGAHGQVDLHSRVRSLAGATPRAAREGWPDAGPAGRED